MDSYFIINAVCEVSMTPKLEVNGVDFSYHTLEGETKALSDISFHVNSGEFLCIVGPSGCGKSTLQHIPDPGRSLRDRDPIQKDLPPLRRQKPGKQRKQRRLPTPRRPFLIYRFM